MDYYSECKEFGGCPCNDEIAEVMKKPNANKKFYIINMSKREEGGSHWVLLFHNDLYFDSFGCEPTLAVVPFAKIYNDTPYQDFHSSACGFYCIYVADRLLAGKDPVGDLIPDDEETLTHSSEHVLRKYFQAPEHNDRFHQGAGFYSTVVELGTAVKDRLKKRFVPRKAESARLRKFLDTIGTNQVTKIEIARKPVNPAITKTFDILSRGKFLKTAKDLNYDDIYHNYLLVTLANGKTYRYQNNQQVVLSEAVAGDYLGARSPIPLPNPLVKGNEMSLKQMTERAAKDDPKFWTYDARDSNCQFFTKKMLERNGLDPAHGPPNQDAAALTGALPTKGIASKMITDLAAYGDQVYHGGKVVGCGIDLNSWY